MDGLSPNELTSLHYSNTNEIAKDFYNKSGITEVVETDGKGVKWGYKELSSDADKKTLAKQLQAYIDSVPAGKRGDLSVDLHFI